VPTAEAGGSRRGGLFVGRLSPEKGVMLLADALTSGPGPGIRVVGEGPEAGRLAGVPGAVWLGPLAREEVLRLMRRASYLVMPSLCYENCPLTLVEAFASGLPAIASRLGAMAELIEDGRTGVLFEPHSVKDLAEKIRWAEANSDQLVAMGKRAREVYESKFTAAEGYRRLMRIYSTAVVRQRDSGDSSRRRRIDDQLPERLRGLACGPR
jgi:glycosyltransferase involved in cell wall biosynthesis